MATQMQQAREGRITDAMKIVAEEERIPVETIRERVAKGTIAICANINNGTDLIPQGQAAFISQTPPHRRKPRESSFGPKSAFRLKNARRPRARLEHGAFGSS